MLLPIHNFADDNKRVLIRFSLTSFGEHNRVRSTSSFAVRECANIWHHIVLEKIMSRGNFPVGGTAAMSANQIDQQKIKTTDLNVGERN
jgi:hypothetical protein